MSNKHTKNGLLAVFTQGSVVVWIYINKIPCHIILIMHTNLESFKSRKKGSIIKSSNKISSFKPLLHKINDSLKHKTIFSTLLLQLFTGILVLHKL